MHIAPLVQLSVSAATSEIIVERCDCDCMVWELLQLPVPGYGTVYCHISEMPTYCTDGSGGHQDIFVRIVGPRRNVNYLNAPSRNNLTYLLNYFKVRSTLRSVQNI